MVVRKFVETSNISFQDNNIAETFKLEFDCRDCTRQEPFSKIEAG